MIRLLYCIKRKAEELQNLFPMIQIYYPLPDSKELVEIYIPDNIRIGVYFESNREYVHFYDLDNPCNEVIISSERGFHVLEII